MTYISKPVIDDNDVLNHVARDLIIEKDDQIMLKRGLKVLTNDGVVHELSFAQVDGLVNILDTSRPVAPVTPLQYLIQAYDLKDMVLLGQDGWIVVEHTIVVLGAAKVVRFEGRLTHPNSVDKEFMFALGGFDFIQQLSLARCIAGLGKEFEQVIGTFDLNYTFKTGPEGTNVYAGVSDEIEYGSGAISR